MSVLSLLDRPIAFNRTFVDLGIGITGALMLSQCVYWSTRTKNTDGWFYKSQTEWQEETGMTRREQETARKNLRAKGYIEEQKRGVPCRVFFKLNREAVERDVLELAQKRQASMAESAKLECTNAPCSDGGNRQTITETTAESTTENTQTPLASGDAKPAKKNTQLPDDFEPNENNRATAEKQGVDLEQELASFKDYHGAKGSKFKNWNLALNTWLRNASKFSRAGNVHAFPGKPRPKHTGLDQANASGLRKRADGAFSL